MTNSYSFDEEFYSPPISYLQKLRPKESIPSKKAEKMRLSGQFKKKPVETFKQSPLLSRVIALQSTLGSWDQLALIEELFGSKVMELVKKSTKQEVVITYLIARWIKKNYPQKEYSLIVRKGISYATNNSNNFEKLEEKYSELVK